MSDQRRRLQRLQERLTAHRTTAADESAEDPRVVYARKWLVDHDVDPIHLDRWLDNQLQDVDLRTYTLLEEARYETWVALGEHFPVNPWLLPCDWIIASTAQRDGIKCTTCSDGSCADCEFDRNRPPQREGGPYYPTGVFSLNNVPPLRGTSQDGNANRRTTRHSKHRS